GGSAAMVSLRLMPRDVRFFDMFRADGQNLLNAARELAEMLDAYDRIVEGIQGTAESMRIYDISAPTDEARGLAGILAEQAVELDLALGLLPSMKGLAPHLRRVHELENQADGLSRAAVGRLFREAHDPLHVIKWRDVYQMLEDSVDAAEDAAEIVARMVHKAS